MKLPFQNDPIYIHQYREIYDAIILISIPKIIPNKKQHERRTAAKYQQRLKNCR